MGLIDKLRAEFVDIIEWVDDSRHTLVWRFPRYHNQIKHGAQLIVRPGQLAVFVRQGKLADVFEPGQHRLETRNLPVLSTLAGWPYGFDSPFKAEVYFVSTRIITDLKWGTPSPVLMRDADFGPVRVRAFGTYTLRALDPRRLLEQLVGADGSFEADEITELLRAVIATAFADLVAKSEIALLDLSKNYQQLSDRLRELVRERIDDEYGLEIPQLFIVNVSVPAEVEQALDVRTSMNMIGDLAGYQAYQLGQSMPVAAANPAGGIAGAGVGVGMGMAIASPFVAGAGRGAPSSPPPPPAPAWWVAEGGQSRGPFTPAQLASSGALRPDTLVWTTGMPDWQPAAQVAALAPLLPPPPRQA
jgi:membrane protease subunit (stomatin/prohibitin family)